MPTPPNDRPTRQHSPQRRVVATCGILRQTGHVTISPYFLLALVIVLAVIAASLWLYDRRIRRRTRLLLGILDLADDLERSLRECRSRLHTVQPIIGYAPPTTSSPSPVLATHIAEPQIQAALRDLLAHRLWLKANAADATMAELVAARDSLRHSRAELDRQLDRLVDATSDLKQAVKAGQTPA